MEYQLLYFLTLINSLYLEMYIGINIAIAPNKTESDAIQNQFPLV